jgi:hypothetical protein
MELIRSHCYGNKRAYLRYSTPVAHSDLALLRLKFKIWPAATDLTFRRVGRQAGALEGTAPCKRVAARPAPTGGGRPANLSGILVVEWNGWNKMGHASRQHKWAVGEIYARRPHSSRSFFLIPSLTLPREKKVYFGFRLEKYTTPSDPYYL